MQTFPEEPSEHLNDESLSLLKSAPHTRCLVSLQPCFVIFFLKPPGDCSSFINDSLSLLLRSAHRLWMCTLSAGMGQ